MKRLLFLCVANSARSQMAEGLARRMFGDRVQVQSAGTQPTFVHPFAVQVLEELDVDISNFTSKSLADLKPEFLSKIDYIITLSEEAILPNKASLRAKHLHWPTPDPVETDIQGFRKARDMIQQKLETFARTLQMAPSRIE